MGPEGTSKPPAETTRGFQSLALLYSVPPLAATTVVRMVRSSHVIIATASLIANNYTRLVHRDTLDKLGEVPHVKAKVPFERR